uniref:Uncharacterized protein n=1 Tax=Arundo donax TaxID=35708 RepID=A0A0A9EER9_ARUDO
MPAGRDRLQIQEFYKIHLTRVLKCLMVNFILELGGTCM